MDKLSPAAVLALGLGGFMAGGCEPPRVERTLADLAVVVDGELGQLRVARGDRVLLEVPVGAIGVRDGDASYTMEFGMFDIQEDLGSWTFADRLELSSTEPISFRLFAGEAELATGTLEEQAGGARLSIRAAAPFDRVVVGSRCTFAHVLGLGAQTHDVDHFGQLVPLWVSEQGVGKTDTDELPALWQLLGRRHTTHVPMPAMVTDVGAFVVDTSAYARLDLCATNAEEARFEVWQSSFALQLWGGETVREAQGKMVDALGRPPPLPSWGLGPGWTPCMAVTPCGPPRSACATSRSPPPPCGARTGAAASRWAPRSIASTRTGAPTR